MKCQKCNFDNLPGNQFCKLCGAPLTPEAQAQMQTQSESNFNDPFEVKANVVSETEIIEDAGSEYSDNTWSSDSVNPNYNIKPSSKDDGLKKVGIGCGIGCLGFIIIIVIGFFVLGHFAKDVMSETLGTIDGWVQDYEEENENLPEPIIYCLKASETGRIVESEASYFGEVMSYSNILSIVDLSTDTGKKLKFKTGNQTLPEDMTECKLFASGAIDENGTFIPEIIYFIPDYADIDITNEHTETEITTATQELTTDHLNTELFDMPDCKVFEISEDDIKLIVPKKGILYMGKVNGHSAVSIGDIVSSIELYTTNNKDIVFYTTSAGIWEEGFWDRVEDNDVYIKRTVTDIGETYPEEVYFVTR